MMDFWQKLPKPIKILAPMEDVTDTVFRRIVLKCGKPDVFFTEFTSVDGLISEGREMVIKRLEYTKDETPLIAQVWGHNPEKYFKAAKEIEAMGFAGIDINMGCPVSKIVGKGSCSALIDNPNLAKEIILATREGCKNIPVSVKTRLGFKNLKTIEWSSFLLDLDLPALTIHGRVAKHLSKYPANWDEIKKVVELRDQMKKETIIIGNGDVQSFQEIFHKYENYKVDGVMIGRGIFNNLFIFNADGPKDMSQLPREKKISMLIDHLNLHKLRWGESTRYATMKKFFKIYINSFSGASELRAELMETQTIDDALNLLNLNISL